MSKEFDSECIELIKVIYRVEPFGGSLHIVLDDGNVDDDCLNFCIAEIMKKIWSEDDDRAWFHYIELACASILCQMDELMREWVIENAWEYMRENWNGKEQTDAVD